MRKTHEQKMAEALEHWTKSEIYLQSAWDRAQTARKKYEKLKKNSNPIQRGTSS